jgi:hypothetical protein
MIDAVVALTLIRSGTRYIFQRKTAGYPLTTYIGQLCLIGGGWTRADDQSPRETAWRELTEEVQPEEALPATMAALRFVGWFDLQLSAAATGARAYHIWDFVYELDLPAGCSAADVRLTEGESMVVDTTAPIQEAFCWGHDHLLRWYAADRAQLASGFPLADGVECRLVSVVEPVAYRNLDLSELRVNPLQTGDLDDRQPIQQVPRDT